MKRLIGLKILSHPGVALAAEPLAYPRLRCLTPLGIAVKHFQSVKHHKSSRFGASHGSCSGSETVASAKTAGKMLHSVARWGPAGSGCSRNNVVEYFAVDIGQAELAALEAVSELCVVDAQQVQDRGL